MTVVMTWLALFSLTALVLLLPMLPALAEWRRPRDATSLHIDAQDALDPDLLARRFADRLAQALAEGADRLGDHALVRLPAGTAGHWPLGADEQARGQSHRVWSVAGSAQLPEGIGFQAEVAADADLHTAAGSSCRALLAGQHLWLAPRTQVLRWAHAPQVQVADDVVLQGRCTADAWLAVQGRARFHLLHAPQLQFGPPAAAAQPLPDTLPEPEAGLPIAWHPLTGRGVAQVPLQMPPGRRWQGDLVGLAAVQLGEGCHARGSLKARRTLVVGAGSRIDGNVIAEGAITLGEGCVVQGVVASETAVRLGRGCRIGEPGRPATVTAPRIEVASGVQVHGTVWAVEAGWAEGLAGPAQAMQTLPEAAAAGATTAPLAAAWKAAT